MNACMNVCMYLYMNECVYVCVYVCLSVSLPSYLIEAQSLEDTSAVTWIVTWYNTVIKITL